jgi:hypothetical protein
MGDITPDQARSALTTVEAARRGVAAEVGLPRGYWWAMAAAWMVLGLLADLAPSWVTTIATIAFGVGHSIVAPRILDGRHRTSGLQVSRSVANRRIPFVVIGMLIALVLLTIGVALGLDADGAGHPSVWAGGFVAAVVGFGGPEIFAVLRRWAHA